MTTARRKTCLYLATVDPTVSDTGTTTRARFFLRALARRFDTHAVYFESVRPEGRDQTLVDSLASAAPVRCTPAGYFVFSRSLLREAARVLREHSCDFIFADFEKAGWYAWVLGGRFGIPYVYSTHNVEYRRYVNVGRTNWLRYPLAPYMYSVERLACRAAALTIAISQPDASVFRRWSQAGDVIVLPCAFDERKMHPFGETARGGRPTVLIVGNYRNAGNRDAAFTAVRRILPAVVSRRPDVVFRFVGPHFPPELQVENVEAPGFVDDLMSEYARAALVIAPVEIGGGIKIKVVEALASGNFLLATPKAMEGIDYSGLTHLEVVPTGRFAERILAALDAPPGRVAANWDRVASRFGVHRALDALCDRLEDLPPSQPAAEGAPSAARR